MPKFATNPETGERVYFDGQQWVPAPHDTGNPAMEQILQGATFGFSDEMQAGLQTGYDQLTGLLSGNRQPIGETYRRNLASLQAAEKTFREENPKTALALNVAGGLATGLTAGSRVMGSPLTQQVIPSQTARLATTGAGAGGLAGAGFSEPGLANRVQGAATGATAGAVLGPTIPLAAKVAGRAGGAVIDRMRTAPSDARRRVAQALTRDAMTPDDWAKNLHKLGPEAVPADAAGANVLDLARTAAMIPGKAKDVAKTVLNARQEGQSQRLLDLFKRTLSPDDFVTTKTTILKEASRKANPFYDEAYSQGLQPTAAMRELFANKDVQRAWSNAQRIANNEGVSLPQIMARDANGRALKMIEVPDMRSMDYIKRGLDQLIDQHTDSLTGRTDTMGRSLTMLKKRFMNQFDDPGSPNFNPAYKQARALYSTEAQADKALGMGYDFIQKTQEIRWGSLAKEFANMSDVEKDMFRLGAAQGLRDRVMNYPLTGDATKKLLHTPAMKEKLKMVFPTQKSMDEFIDTVSAESTFFETRNIVQGGSRTAEILAGQKELASPLTGGIAEDLAQGRVINAGIQGVRALLEKAGNIPESTRTELANLLFTKDSAEVLRQINRMVARKQLTKAAADKITTAISIVSGEGAGAALAP